MAINNHAQRDRRLRHGVGARRPQKKSGWDKWAVVFQGIAALAIPVSLLGVYIGVRQFSEQQAAGTAQALDQQHQTTLDGYLNDMSALVLNDGLATPDAIAGAKAIAVARTDTAVRDLDGARKGILVRYLWEAGLITGPQPIVELYEVNLSEAMFTGANLWGADLSTNDLVGADFYDADAYGSDLSKADLSRANLSRADLSCFPGRSLDISAGIVIQKNIKNVACVSLNDANLSEANLQNTDLVGADLSGANLSGADLDKASYNSKPIYVKDASGNSFTVKPTQWPQGFNAAASGLICVDC